MRLTRVTVGYLVIMMVRTMGTGDIKPRSPGLVHLTAVELDFDYLTALNVKVRLPYPAPASAQTYCVINVGADD